MSNVDVDITRWERHNVVSDSAGGLRTRLAFSSLATMTGRDVGSFSVRSPSTTDVWHYVFTQATTTGIVTLTVYTEELVALFTYVVGPCADSPVITHAVVYGQIMISSPSFSVTLYGLVGGGIMAAYRVPSVNPDTTALDIPVGHICSFGDRVAIAEGRVVFFNDPPSTSVDLRTFVAQNAFALPGAVLDMFQGVDGALYMFTTVGVYTLPADAIGQGQSVIGYLSRVPGLESVRPRNACPTPFGVVMLDAHDVVVVNSGKRIPVGTYTGQRVLSNVIDVDDLRIFGELYPTQNGVLLGFRDTRDFYVDVDLRTSTASYVYSSSGMSLMSVVIDRDGWENHIVNAKVSGTTAILSQEVTGTTEYDGGNVAGRLCGSLDLGPSQRPLVRRASTSYALAGALVAGAVERRVDSATASTSSAAIVGTSTWSSTGIGIVGRSKRSSRMTFNVRSSNPSVEFGFTGGGFAIADTVEMQLGGLDVNRKDKET